MDNEVQRITNQSHFERLQRTYLVLQTPELAVQGAPDYSVVAPQAFGEWPTEAQRGFLRRMNEVCARLFARNLRLLPCEAPLLWDLLCKHAEQAALCALRIAEDELLLVRRRCVYDIATLTGSIVGLVRQQPALALTAVVDRLVQFASVIMLALPRTLAPPARDG